jgi:hypothetical protein
MPCKYFSGGRLGPHGHLIPFFFPENCKNIYIFKCYCKFPVPGHALSRGHAFRKIRAPHPNSVTENPRWDFNDYNVELTHKSRLTKPLHLSHIAIDQDSLAHFNLL